MGRGLFYKSQVHLKDSICLPKESFVKSRIFLSAILLLILLATLAACGAQPQSVPPVASQSGAESAAEHADGAHATDEQAEIATPDHTFTLETATSGGFIYVGDDGVKNPELRVPVGTTVGLTLVNGDGIEHDLSIDDLGVHSEHIVQIGASSTVSFHAKTPGTYVYYCTLPGHRQAGMEGILVVEEN